MNGYTVYKHTSPSGKVYIGITSKKPERRWDNGKGYRDCPHMSRAVSKYGWDNFTHEILAEGLCKEDAEDMEVRLIAELRSNDGVYGYNITSGGYSPGTLSDETRAKMSASRKGRIVSEETRRKISAAHKGVPLSPEHLDASRAASAKRRGIPLPEETKKKLRQANLGRIRSPETCRKIREVHLGTSHSEETKTKISETKKGSPLTPRGAANHKSRAVVCVETGEVFDCIRAAAEAKGINTARNIGRSCKRGDRCGGFHWRYYEDCNCKNENI